MAKAVRVRLPSDRLKKFENFFKLLVFEIRTSLYYVCKTTTNKGVIYDNYYNY